MSEFLAALLGALALGYGLWWQRREARPAPTPVPPVRRQPCLRWLPHYVPAWGLISEDGGHVGRMPGNGPYRRQVEATGAYDDEGDIE